MNITKRFSVSTCICLYYGVFLTLIPSESYAQNNAPPPTAGVDVELSFVTTYIDRGSDLLSDSMLRSTTVTIHLTTPVPFNRASYGIL
ncbi:MAG: hypothetical protein KDK34_04730, partial [Leptospiraceae bacterium]|nr:hypothetical protein [Leptospiraceae bacterium]